VALAAANGAMHAQKREFCFGMIEAVDVRPGFCVVAGFAAERRTIGAFAGHAIVELALVWIGVAGGAGAVLKMEGENFVGAAGRADFMAIGAGDRGMCASKGKTRAAVLGDGVGSAVEIDNRVAGLAAVVVRSRGELIVVSVLVAIAAEFEFDAVDCVFSGGDVTLGAIHLDVLALQRVVRGVMLFHAEERGFPAVHGVALGAFASLRASFELALVRIGFVAVVAIYEG
jgi:hypothetical protein